MADIVVLKRKDRRETTAWVGMVVFLGSWAMLFAPLFFVYGMLRARAPAWPPADVPRLPQDLPGLNTIVLVASSALLQIALWAARQRRMRIVAPSIGAATILAVAFLSLQIVVWLRMLAVGLEPGAGSYPAVFYGLSALHALHVAVGIVPLALLALRGARGELGPARHLSLRLWTMYWHFVGVVWVLMYVLIYLV